MYNTKKIHIDDCNATQRNKSGFYTSRDTGRRFRKSFSQWSIESHFITNKYNDKEFLLPQDIHAKVVLLPDRENFYSDPNKSFLQTYIERFKKGPL